MFHFVSKIGFFCLLIGAAIWFMMSAAWALFDYNRYSHPIIVIVEGWEATEPKKDAFKVLVHFSFEKNGEKILGKAFLERSYPNRWAAEKAAQSKKSTTVLEGWMDPKNPKRVVLERDFPWKKVLSAGVILGVFGYFVCLALYTRRF